MDSYTIAVGKFFNDKVCLLVPLFQRPYVWKQEEQWEPLWNDISAVTNRVATSTDPRPHFIGAVVLEALPRKVGRLEHRLVIDGHPPRRSRGGRRTTSSRPRGATARWAMNFAPNACG